MPLCWGGLSSVDKHLMQSTCMQNLTILVTAVPEISLGASKVKVGHVTLTTRLLKTICHPDAGT